MTIEMNMKGATIMPLLDMPLERLRTYEGRNPRPADHEAYWEASLKEMHAVDPQLEFIPAAFQSPFAECYDLYFTGVRGARIHVKHLRPKNASTPKPAVLMFHGYSGDSGDWQSKLSFVTLGYSVFAMDVRGQGGLSEETGGVKGTTLRGHIIRGLDDHPENLLFRHIFLDTAQLASIAMSLPFVDETNVYATGGSQGGGLTMACAALEPRIRKAALLYPFLSDYKRVWEMDQAKDAYEELRYFFRNFDPQHKKEDDIFTKLGYIDIQFLASRIQAETLIGIGLMDSICPPSTQFAAINKMTAPVELEIYPDFGHEGLPGFHDKIYSFFS
jgi:cephalosporin-C deacetylase